MGGFVGSDGLTDEDRDESLWLQSDKDCEGCNDNIKYADECVLLRLVYPAPHTGKVTLLDAIDGDDGSYTAEPILFCFSCWDAYTDDLRSTLNNLFISKKRSVGPSPLKCAYCQTPINWGDYCCYAMYGELDVSPRTHASMFTPSPYETVDNAELICMDCMGVINEENEESIWIHLWVEEDVIHEQENG